MATAIRAVNAAVISQTTTAVTAMRVTAVRPCRVYFQADCYGIDPTDNKVIGKVVRGRSNGTPGSALTPTALDSTDADTVGNLATFLDTFSAPSSGGTEIEEISIHPQGHRYTMSHKLAVGETLDLETDMYAADTVPIKVQAFVRDLN